ncbi:hypothetical protein K445DRAFT_314480, partial [Daldinia sp. EC12]
MASDSNAQPTGTSSPSSETYVVESDDCYSEENDPEMLDPQQPDHEGYTYGNHNFQFSQLNDLIRTHTAASAAAIRPDSPYNSCDSRELHNKSQRAVWQEILNQAKAAENIPKALFSPPRTYIEVRVTEWPIVGHYCCPCDINETACEVIEIRAPKESENGITKGMFIQQISNAMYGRTAKADESDEGANYRIGSEDDRPVIEQFDYKIHQKDSDKEKIMGHLFALTKGLSPKLQHEST